MPQLPEGARYLLDLETWTTTWGWLREVGEEGFESAVVWIGRESATDVVEIVRPHRPSQIAVCSEDGVAVEVTEEGMTALILGLQIGEFVAVRLHTHPERAYHSAVDDRNMLISHPGAISVVVPDFASGSPDLDRCSVNELDADGQWRELSRRTARKRLVIR